MSMGSKRRGWRAQRNLYNYLSRDLAWSDERERWQPVLDALKLCYKEIEQFHGLRYADCHQTSHPTPETCPAWEAMLAARKQLERFEVKP